MIDVRKPTGRPFLQNYAYKAGILIYSKGSCLGLLEFQTLKVRLPKDPHLCQVRCESSLIFKKIHKNISLD